MAGIGPDLDLDLLSDASRKVMRYTMTISKKAEDFNLLVVRNIVDNFSQRDDNKKGVHSFIYKLTHKNYRCSKPITYNGKTYLRGQFLPKVFWELR